MANVTAAVKFSVWLHVTSQTIKVSNCWVMSGSGQRLGGLTPNSVQKCDIFTCRGTFHRYKWSVWFPAHCQVDLSVTKCSVMFVEGESFSDVSGDGTLYSQSSQTGLSLFTSGRGSDRDQDWWSGFCSEGSWILTLSVDWTSCWHV